MTTHVPDAVNVNEVDSNVFGLNGCSIDLYLRSHDVNAGNSL